jgi:hypothetical protein
MSSASDVIPEFAQVIISTFLGEARPFMILLMLGTALSAILIPLLFSLFAFSTPQTRRTMMFIKCVFDITLGLAAGIYSIYVEASLRLTQCYPAYPN